MHKKFLQFFRLLFTITINKSALLLKKARGIRERGKEERE